MASGRVGKGVQLKL
uniref:Uncharacterized protein n=1 Tax=Anguilla anguilla TaxID=7936 RepID=A0A0E9TST7_ANGAN